MQNTRFTGVAYLIAELSEKYDGAIASKYCPTSRHAIPKTTDDHETGKSDSHSE